MYYQDHNSNGVNNKFDAGETSKASLRLSPGLNLLSSGSFIGKRIYNTTDEYLGKIKEIILDLASGETRYAVLSFGGFFGLGTKLFAVPWNVLLLDIARKRFILDVRKDRIKEMPDFERNNWPDVIDQSWPRGTRERFPL